MSNSTTLLSSYTRNGVLPLKLLKSKNYPLFKYVMNNYELVAANLQECGISIMNDLKSKKDLEVIRLYLKYHFGDTVNLTLLRKNHRTIYSYISFQGKVAETIKELGFSIYHEHVSSEQDIIEELKQIADTERKISQRLEPPLYYKLYYRANKLGLSLKEYTKQLGFIIEERVDLSAIVRMRDQEHKSFGEIAKALGIPKSTVRKYYSDVKKDETEGV